MSVGDPLADRQRVVGIAEMLVSSDPDDVLVTFSLGSCLGIAAWDGVARVAGLLHCLLPSSAEASRSDSHPPARFVDRGVSALLRSLLDAGARPEDLVIKVAGAASPLLGCEGFRIGERNHDALRRVLEEYDLRIAAERVGGSEARTLSLRVADGRTVVRVQGSEEVI